MTRFLLPPSAAPTPAAIWVGRVVSAIIVAFLLLDGTIKVLDLAVVQESMRQLGYPPEFDQALGVVTLTIAVLYAVPRTSVLGAVLMTGLLGGAIATHLRVGSPVFSHLLFGLYVGLLAWAGLWLRNARLRALLPLGRA